MAVIIVYIFVLFHRGAGSEQALAPVLGKGSYDGEQEGGHEKKGCRNQEEECDYFH